MTETKEIQALRYFNNLGYIEEEIIFLKCLYGTEEDKNFIIKQIEEFNLHYRHY